MFSVPPVWSTIEKEEVTRSDTSTVPDTPKSDSGEIPTLDGDDVFAWLRPVNTLACEAFDATVNTVIKDDLDFDLDHFYKFLHCDSRQNRAVSVYSEDGDSSHQQSSAPPHRWAGAFGFCLTHLPQNPAKGWRIGTNRARGTSGEVDLMLAPPNEHWRKADIAGSHARLALHPQSCRMTLEAKHTVTLGRDGAKPFRQAESRVLEDGEVVIIGACVYTFQYTDYFFSSAFGQEVAQYMRKYRDSHWSMNDYISPSSVGAPVSMGNYYCSPRAFAQGSFGKLSAGWTESGEAVAFKTFKKPVKSEIRSHVELMELIGRHVSSASTNSPAFAKHKHRTT